MKIASVILDIPTKALDGAYTYLVPDGDVCLRVQGFDQVSLYDLLDEADPAPEEAFEVAVGCAVLVPLGAREVVGFVVDVKEVSCEQELPAGVSAGKLKPIIRALGHPYFTPTGARCARFLAER